MPGLWQVGETEEDDEAQGFDIVEQLKKGLQDPRVQMRLYERAQEQGIDPQILQGFLPGNDVEPGDVLEALENQRGRDTPPESSAQGDKVRKPGIPDEERDLEPTDETNAATTQNTTMPTQTQDFDADKLLDIIDQIIEIHGEDTTLGEFKDWAEDNTDLIENFADQLA